MEMPRFWVTLGLMYVMLRSSVKDLVAVKTGSIICVESSKPLVLDTLESQFLKQNVSTKYYWCPNLVSVQ